MPAAIFMAAWLKRMAVTNWIGDSVVAYLVAHDRDSHSSIR